MRERPARRSLFAVLVVSVVASGCGDRPDPSRITASGHIEATEVRLSTKVGGTLIALAVREGDRVEAGQEIGRIDTTDLDLLLRQASAERSAAQAELRLRLAGARSEDIAELKQQIASVAADLEGAELEFRRMQSLLDRGSGTEKARDDARARRDMVRARLDAMKVALARLEAGNRVEEIDVSRARLSATEARIAQIEQHLRDATLVSPVAGVVTEKLAEAGELLTPGAGIAVITELGAPWLTVYVSEPDLGRIRIGQEAEVVTDDGQSRLGSITFIASQAEFTPKNVQTRDERVKLVFKVKVGLDNADLLFKPGMPAEARIAAAGGAR